MPPMPVVPGSLAALLSLLRPSFTAPTFDTFRWLRIPLKPNTLSSSIFSRGSLTIVPLLVGGPFLSTALDVRVSSC